jgi:hypothetical protein
MSRLVLAVFAGLVRVAVSGDAVADPTTAEQEAASTWAGSRSLRDHFGVEAARRLLQGGESVESAAVSADTLRGIDRAADLGTPEAVALLVRLLQDAHGPGRWDARVLLAATRALAPFASSPSVARALADVTLNAPATAAAARPGTEGRPPPSDTERRGRVELARETAALALVETRDEHAIGLVAAAARQTGPGRAAALRSLALSPHVAAVVSVAPTPEAIAQSATLADLRAAETFLAASRSLDPQARVAALRGLAVLGDARGLGAAEASTHDADAAVREAAARALVELGAGDVAQAVRRLIEDDATAQSGVELSTRVRASELVGALAARVRASSDLTLRRAAIAALGRQEDPEALAVLAGFLADPLIAGDAAQAIARCRLPAAWGIISRALGDPSARRMGARMAALRGRVLGDVPDSVARSLRDLSRATDGADRAAGFAALVSLGRPALSLGLADGDARVRRAVAMACEPTDPVCGALLLGRLAGEGDAPTRLLLAAGLASVDGLGTVTTSQLLDRVRQGEADAPLCVLALARRADDRGRDAVDAALRSSDPFYRAHAARGLAVSVQPWAVGSLAQVYEEEVDAGVRRSVLLALAARTADVSTPLRARTLDRAARLDPEASIRAVAGRALRGLALPDIAPARDELWLRVATQAGAPPAGVVAGLVLRSDGLAIPVVFDDDGYALLPAPTGPARLLLAPRPRAYEAPHHEP